MKKITLFDYLQLTEQGEEITVHDKEYDTETYFYSNKSTNKDLWDASLEKLSQLLTITKIYSNSIEVNLSEIIEKKLPQLRDAELFITCEIDDIMDDIDNILAGNVSEKWIEKFVNILEQ